MKTVFKFFKPYAWLIALSILFVSVHSITEIMLPASVSDIINNGVALGDMAYISGQTIKMVIIVLVSVIFSLCEGYVVNRAAVSAGRDMRRAMFSKVESLDQETFSEHTVASLLVRTTNDIQLIQNVSSVFFRSVFTAPIMIVGIIFAAWSKNSKLALIFLSMIPIMIIVIAIIGRKIMPIAQQQQKNLDTVNKITRENLTGVRVIRAFHNEQYEQQRFDEANLRYANAAKKVQKIVAVITPVFLLVLNFATIGVALTGAKQVSLTALQPGGLQPGDVMQMIQYTMMIMMQIMMLSMIIVMFPRIAVSAKRIENVLKEDISIVTPENPITPKEEDYGKIEFKNVDFSFGESEEKVLHNLNFEINKNEVLAIIGGTGSGKSTLLNLIPRMLDVDENKDGTRAGQVLVSGVDVRDQDLETLRSKIAFVPQNRRLFTGTIEDNIRYGYPDATEEDIMNALKVANAENFVKEKKDGLQEHVAEGGNNFSGGQQQRLTIARAVVRPAEFYIFDDSFSALDFKTEKEVRAAVTELAGKRDSTLVIVGQRVSSIMDADRILVLDEGRIVGQGKHKDLLETCDIYRQIAESQLSEEELAV